MRRDHVRVARAAASALALSIAFALAGCTPPSEVLEDAVEQGIASTATAGIALELEADGRLLRTTALNAVEDARSQAADAARTATLVRAGDEVDAGRQAEASAALQEAVDALSGAADALDGIGDPADAATELAAAEDALRALTRQGRP